MKISIITPSFNQANFIERTIQSVLNQGIAELEYIIIDGGSTDGTLDILKQYQGKLTWISEKDNGQSDAINKGLHMATGDIVAFLNSDDTYEPDALKHVIEFFSMNPDLFWAYGKCRIIDEKDNEIRKFITWYKNLLLGNFSFTKLLTENFISQPATFWRREVHDKIGFLNEEEHFCMDYEFWLRLSGVSNPGVINSYLSNFRIHDESKSGSVNKKQFQDELRLAQKYGERHTLALFLHKLNYYKITWIYRLLSFIK